MSLTARIVSALLAAAVVLIILKLQRRGGMGSKYGLLWTATSAMMLVLATAPDVADTVGGWLGVDYTPSLVFMAALSFVLIVLVQYSWELNRTEQRIQVLMEEVALLRRELEDRNDQTMGAAGTPGQQDRND
ncbi:DUF2304 domain-containing protein [Candidatus Poriferisocius sp.]|uniref:DUF2304 domain-containing protein n=1 Tax=Candidatus Poriferisocius sp. TaxID=3101276 RepID=UPI003B026880